MHTLIIPGQWVLYRKSLDIVKFPLKNYVSAASSQPFRWVTQWQEILALDRSNETKSWGGNPKKWKQFFSCNNHVTAKRVLKRLHHLSKFCK